MPRTINSSETYSKNNKRQTQQDDLDSSSGDDAPIKSRLRKTPRVDYLQVEKDYNFFLKHGFNEYYTRKLNGIPLENGAKMNNETKELKEKEEEAKERKLIRIAEAIRQFSMNNKAETNQPPINKVPNTIEVKTVTTTTTTTTIQSRIRDFEYQKENEEDSDDQLEQREDQKDSSLEETKPVFYDALGSDSEDEVYATSPIRLVNNYRESENTRSEFTAAYYNSNSDSEGGSSTDHFIVDDDEKVYPPVIVPDFPKDDKKREEILETMKLNDEETTTKSCCLCMEYAPVVAPVSCGHMCMCLLCSQEYSKYRTAPKPECPLCKKEFDVLIRIFYN